MGPPRERAQWGPLFRWNKNKRIRAQFRIARIVVARDRDL
jgi:hypothetical protein